MTQLDRPSWSRADLDSMQHTEQHGHGPMVLSGVCHPKATQVVRYFGDGMIELACKMCASFICRIAVAHSSIERLQPKLDVYEGAIEEKHLAVRNVCHEGVGLRVVYLNGQLRVMCGKCHAIIDTVDVKQVAVSA